MQTYLSIAQMIVSITLIALILIQAQGHGVGGVFGGGGSSVHQQRRGVERTVYHLTIAFSVLFLLISLLNVI